MIFSSVSVIKKTLFSQICRITLSSLKTVNDFISWRAIEVSLWFKKLSESLLRTSQLSSVMLIKESNGLHWTANSHYTHSGEKSMHSIVFVSSRLRKIWFRNKYTKSYCLFTDRIFSRIILKYTLYVHWQLLNYKCSKWSEISKIETKLVAISPKNPVNGLWVKCK